MRLGRKSEKGTETGNVMPQIGGRSDALEDTTVSPTLITVRFCQQRLNLLRSNGVLGRAYLATEPLPLLPNIGDFSANVAHMKSDRSEGSSC